MGERLLRHNLTFGSDSLTCHADPSALDDVGTSGQQAGPRASEGMGTMRSMAPPHPGLELQRLEQTGRGRRKHAQATPQSDLPRPWRDAACLRSGVGAEKGTQTGRQDGRSTGPRECAVRDCDAWCCQPCGQSLAPGATGRGEHRRGACAIWGSRSSLAWSCKVRRACAASARQRTPFIELQP